MRQSMSSSHNENRNHFLTGLTLKFWRFLSIKLVFLGYAITPHQWRTSSSPVDENCNNLLEFCVIINNARVRLLIFHVHQVHFAVRSTLIFNQSMAEKEWVVEGFLSTKDKMHLLNWRDQVAVHDSEEFINERNWEETNGCTGVYSVMIGDKHKTAIEHDSLECHFMLVI